MLFSTSNFPTYFCLRSLHKPEKFYLATLNLLSFPSYYLNYLQVQLNICCMCIMLTLYLLHVFPLDSQWQIQKIIKGVHCTVAVDVDLKTRVKILDRSHAHLSKYIHVWLYSRFIDSWITWYQNSPGKHKRQSIIYRGLGTELSYLMCGQLMHLHLRTYV